LWGTVIVLIWFSLALAVFGEKFGKALAGGAVVGVVWALSRYLDFFQRARRRDAGK
jgi:hypothetical protein